MIDLPSPSAPPLARWDASADVAPAGATLAAFLATAQHSWAARRLNVERVEFVEPDRWQPRHGDLCCVRVEQVGASATVAMADGARVELQPRSSVWMLWDGVRPEGGPPSIGLPRSPAPGPHPCAVHHESGTFGAPDRAAAAAATLVRPLAVAWRRDGRPGNVRHGAAPLPRWNRRVPPVLVVMPSHAGIGADAVMQVAARLTRTCSVQGIRIGALQLAGPGPEPGMARVAAAGAALSLDLADAGFCGSTQCSPLQLTRAFLHQLNLLAQAEADLALACTSEHAMSPAMCALLASSALRGSLCGVCLVEDPADPRPAVASSALAALEVPMVTAHPPPIVPAAQPDHARDDLRELAMLLRADERPDFEITRPSWWLV